MPKENNNMQVDIENLFKQNVNDLSAIKELYRKLQDMENKILQIKYIDSNLANKLKKEYEKLKKIILDENIQAKLTDDIETINSKLDSNVQQINDLYVNIRNYPRLAVETNDTPRIQRALNENSRVYLPNGTYNVTKLVLNTNNVLCGESIKGVIINGIDNNVVSVIYSDLSANNYSIENMLIKAPSGVIGILLDNVGELSKQDLHPEIRNVIILGGSRGLNIKSGVRGGLYDNVRPGDSEEIGIAMESTDSIFTNCIVAMSKYDGFKVVNGNNTFINCKAFCCGDSKIYGAGFKLQGSFNRLLNCEFQQNRFENLYLQNANSNIIQGCILDSAGWGAKTYFPKLTYADNGNGSQVPISSLRSYSSKKNVIDVTIINGRLNGNSKTAFYCQYEPSDTENIIRFTTNDILEDGVFTDYQITNSQNYFKNNQLTINGEDKKVDIQITPTIVSSNSEVIKGGYIERDGIVYVDVVVKSLVTLNYPSELLSGFPKPKIDTSMNNYFTEYKRTLINTNGKLIVGATVTTDDTYYISGCYIKA